jgi:dienelactone hydrolase
MLGSLDSIITSDSLTTDSVKFIEFIIGKDDIYLVEMRPQDNGRCVIYSTKEKKDLTPPPFSSKNGVHEYGTSSLCEHQGSIYFTFKKDQQIYEIKDKKVRKITDCPQIRFGEPCGCGSILFAIFEDHSDEENIKNGIMRIEKATGKCDLFESNHDFYSGLTLSPDEQSLAYFTWDFPNMSWDASDVWKISLSKEKRILEKKQISQKGDISSFAPQFFPNGDLYFISDISGYWNIYKEDNTPLCPSKHDFSKAHWRYNNPFFAPLASGSIAAVRIQDALDVLGEISKGTFSPYNLPFTYYTSIKSIENTLYFIAGSPTHPLAFYSFNTETKALIEIKISEKNTLPKEWTSIPKPISFTTRHNETSHAFFYPPKNPTADLTQEKPPLLLISHGGPTSHSPALFSLSIQYFTSRGFAVCDVNYSGSTGYGRSYRNRLYKNWGIKDLDDCEDCALYLIKEGLVDKKRLSIKGGSAGGFTTLALLTFRETFAVGASYFGVSDLALLAEHTHKFESRYLDKLIGNYPEEKALYDKRSPLYHTKMLKKPILLLQGDEDKIVPKDQASKMYRALLEKKIPTAYLLFKEEGHGFCKDETIRKAIDSELYFYQTVFRQKTTFKTPPLIIDNI